MNMCLEMFGQFYLLTHQELNQNCSPYFKEGPWGDNLCKIRLFWISIVIEYSTHKFPSDKMLPGMMPIYNLYFVTMKVL